MLEAMVPSYWRDHSVMLKLTKREEQRQHLEEAPCACLIPGLPNPALILPVRWFDQTTLLWAELCSLTPNPANSYVEFLINSTSVCDYIL